MSTQPVCGGKTGELGGEGEEDQKSQAARERAMSRDNDFSFV